MTEPNNTPENPQSAPEPTEAPKAPSKAPENPQSAPEPTEAPKAPKEPTEAPKALKETKAPKAPKASETPKEAEEATQPSIQEFEARLAAAEETIKQAKIERDQAKRDQLITANSVPEELLSLLPNDPEALEVYLKSDSYKAIKAKISAATKPQEPEDKSPKGSRPPGEKAPPKGEKRVFGSLDRSEIVDLGALIVGSR